MWLSKQTNKQTKNRKHYMRRTEKSYTKRFYINIYTSQELNIFQDKCIEKDWEKEETCKRNKQTKKKWGALKTGKKKAMYFLLWLTLYEDTCSANLFSLPDSICSSSFLLNDFLASCVSWGTNTDDISQNYIIKRR